jgi:hypothetical protein
MPEMIKPPPGIFPDLYSKHFILYSPCGVDFRIPVYTCYPESIEIVGYRKYNIQE